MRREKGKIMDLQTALKELQTGKIAPIYLLTGTEQYLIELFKKNLSQAIFKGDGQLNSLSFDMEETSLEVAIEEAETVPFFDDYRLIFIKNPYFLMSERKNKEIEQNIDRLIDYIKQPLATSVVVLIANVAKLDQRKKITKLLQKQAKNIDVNSMNERELYRYTEETIKAEGYTIRADALELLMQLTNFNLSKLINETQKLFSYAWDTKIITYIMVKELVPRSLEDNVFELANKLLIGKTDEAIELYKDLVLQGEEIIKLNAILINQMRLLIQTKILVQLGYQQANIVETLGIHPYRVKIAMQQVRNSELKHLEGIYDGFIENDYAMKTSKMDKELLFQLTILKLTGSLKKYKY